MVKNPYYLRKIEELRRVYTDAETLLIYQRAKISIGYACWRAREAEPGLTYRTLGKRLGYSSSHIEQFVNAAMWHDQKKKERVELSALGPDLDRNKARRLLETINALIGENTNV